MTDTKTTERPQAEMAPPQEAPEPKLPALRGGGGINAIIPQNFEEAYRMARVIVAAGTAPKSYEMKDPTDLKPYVSVERVAVAIMAGLEVGLKPLQAVQGIAVINGIPTVYGDARDALVEASGLLEDRVEEHELDDDGLFLWWRCTVWRRGRKTPIIQTVTRAQAARAGWLKKTGPWQESPNRMAQERARGWAYRDAFPDVLKGLADRNEVLDMVDITSRSTATMAPPPPKRADFKEPAQPPAAASPAEEGPAGSDSQPEAADRPEPTTNPWAIPENVVGAEPKRKYILERLLPEARVKADIEAIETQHDGFLKKLGRLEPATRRAIVERGMELPEHLEMEE